MASLFQGAAVAVEAVHQLFKVLVAGNLKTTLTGLESLGLLELLVVGAEDDGNVPYGSLQCVVDANTKAAAHIGHIGIVVDTRQQAEAVDNQDFSISKG